MGKAYVLYNPLAGNGRCAEDIHLLDGMISDEKVLWDMTASEDYGGLFASMEEEDYVILCGGDGTLNRFINQVTEEMLEREILYFPSGSGNDFAHDLGHQHGDAPFAIGKYLRDLPTVEIRGKTWRVLNGVGYGIDGYCCQVGDHLRATSDKKINYTGIAIKGLLFHYKPKNVTVTVDGVPHTYRKVWLTPTMQGRYYGGGMIPTPDQDRLNEEGSLSVMVLHGCSKWRVLTIFPSIFKGEHVKCKKQVEILTGREITVEYDVPTAAQIDGETVLDVTSLTVRAASPCGAKKELATQEAQA
ncbi:MAG: diacylglycerol kinase family protein [Clostridia bacterium]|nr:diacylglycerol kinase family protein [Clostridia bacterium]